MNQFSYSESNQYDFIFLVQKIDEKKLDEVILSPYGIAKSKTLILSLYLDGTKKKTSVSTMRDYYQTELLPKIQAVKAKYVIVMSTDYFKMITKVTKSDNHLGQLFTLDELHYCYCPCLQSMFYDPIKVSLKIKTAMSYLVNHSKGVSIALGSDIIKFEKYPSTYEEIKATLEMLVLKNTPLTVDIETYSLKHPTSGLGSITFCWNQHEGVAFLIDSSPTKINYPIRQLLKDFFIRFNNTLIYHNIAFDVYILVYQLFMKDLLDTKGLLHGLEVLLKNWEDTKLISYLATNSCSGNKLSLKDQAQEYMGNYALGEIKDITKVPTETLLQYNLKDGLATWFTYNKNYPTMVQENQEEIYRTLFKPAIKDIIQMQLTGLPINPQRVQEVKAELEAIRFSAYQGIKLNPSVQEYIHQCKEQWVIDKNKTYKKKRVTLDDANIIINPKSHTQLANLLYSFLELPVLAYTESKAPAVDKDTLKQLHALGSHTELLEHLITFADVDILLTTFLSAFEKAYPSTDGRSYLFGNFNLGGTVSGRLSSSKINLQNLPSTGTKYAKLIKSCFQAPNGWLFVGIDFNSLEDRISALTTKDTNKLKVYEQGYDGHSLRAYAYFKDQMPLIQQAEPTEKCYRVTLEDGSTLYLKEGDVIVYKQSEIQL